VVLVFVDRPEYVQATNKVNHFRVKEREAIDHDDRKFFGSFLHAEDVVDGSLEESFLVSIGEPGPPVCTKGGLAFGC
jgi:hypothetical protein